METADTPIGHRDNDTDVSEDVHETAEEMAADFEQSDTIVVPRSEVVAQLKRRLDVQKVQHDDVRSGFEEAGWTYGRHLYFHPGRVADRVEEIVAELREDGQLVVTHDEVCDRIVDDEHLPRENIKGWAKGKFPEAVEAALEPTDWRADTLQKGGTSRRVYILPLYEQFARNHPKGERPLSLPELFSHYLSVSVEEAIEPGSEVESESED